MGPQVSTTGLSGSGGTGEEGGGDRASMTQATKTRVIVGCQGLNAVDRSAKRESDLHLVKE